MVAVFAPGPIELAILGVMVFVPIAAVITDPWFYAVAVPAVLLFGISKGGFAGGFGIVAVPMMALVISPVQAAAILLPILCVMDLVALWRFRGEWVGSELRLLLPASLVGIGAGTLLFEYMSPAVVRLVLGGLAVLFTLHFWQHRRRSAHARPPDFGVDNPGRRDRSKTRGHLPLGFGL